MSEQSIVAIIAGLIGALATVGAAWITTRAKISEARRANDDASITGKKIGEARRASSQESSISNKVDRWLIPVVLYCWTVYLFVISCLAWFAGLGNGQAPDARWFAPLLTLIFLAISIFVTKRKLASPQSN